MGAMKVIATAGKKQSGKDTVYHTACEICKDSRVGRVAFGDLVKHEVSEITGFRVDHIEKHKEEFRTLLQVWGSDFRRNICGSEYWIDKMERIIAKSSDSYDFLFVTDVRFPNEADLIKKLKGTLIRVERRETSYPSAIDTHASETALDDYPRYDYVLNNDKCRDTLRDRVVFMLETLGLYNAKESA